MRKLLLASVVLLLLTNVVVLAGIAYNRSGEPVLSIELTERELPLMTSAGFEDENSGTSLLLRWQIFVPEKGSDYVYHTYSTPDWLDNAKLTELGFDIQEFKSDTDKYQYKTSHLSREVVLVLEYQGDTYRKSVALAKERVALLAQDAADLPADDDMRKKLGDAEKQLAYIQTSRTRLHVIDAGVDKEALIQQYADKENVLLVRGEIGLKWNQGIVSGRIRQIFLKYLHVPLPLSEQLVVYANGETYSAHDQHMTPRYRVRLNIGKRLEPWIESVTKIE